MVYIDTSLLVAALTAEPMTGHVQQWLANQEAGELTISSWTVTELSSAFSIKIRTGHLTRNQRDTALSAFRKITSDSFEVFSVLPVHFHTAANFSDQSELGLRAGDALHLAVATERRAAIYTLDRRFCTAVNRMGIHCVCLYDHDPTQADQ
jgi:predicted nucleic acid-binding protein